jgi:AmmeMemoRadiSam system protein B/AmmeMemoRadiSam system protein A
MKTPIFSASLCILFASLACASPRPCAVAGKFYPEDKAELAREVDSFLEKAPSPKALPPVLGLLVPHAGYEFSAPAAAWAYKAVSGSYEVVAILGAAHAVRVPSAALYAKGSFATPLGELAVDEPLAAKLLASRGIFSDMPEAHAREHSVEVQLPFLIRRLKPGFKILPIVMNTEDPEAAVRAGKVLGAALKGRKALLVVSSDLSHYPGEEVARRADRTTLAALERMDPDYLRLAGRILMARREKNLECAACGEAALLAGMAAAKVLGADNAVILKYENSAGSPRGDARSVVGYGAAAFVRSGRPAPSGIELGEAQRKALLRLARQAVESRLGGGEADSSLSEDPSLNLPAAVFVTLTEGGRLRGCIGTTEPRATLRDAVISSALSAAFEDHRFRPVSKGELGSIHYEISILSPHKEVPSAEAILPRKHGVIVSREGRAGLFLPQVWEQIPDKAEFLGELCSQKAGLERECWKDPGTRLSVFTVEAFE